MISAKNRFNSWKKAVRKKKIDEAISNHPLYDNLHQYSKNSIHCDCPNCSPKTKNKGKRRYKHGNYAPSKNYKISDQRRLDQMDMDDNGQEE